LKRLAASRGAKTRWLVLSLAVSCGACYQLQVEQSIVPDELLEGFPLNKVRWELERHAALQGDAWRDAVAALKACTDEQIHTMLELHPDWHEDEHGAWYARAPFVSRAGLAGAAHLHAIRGAAKATVTTERTVSHMVQLLRDPAYAEVSLPRKLHQLTKYITTELVRAQRAGERHAASVSWAGSAVPEDSTNLVLTL